MNIPILMYHGILPSIDNNPSSLAVSEKNFREQMEYMKHKGYTSMLLSELAAAINSKIQLPPKPFAITFDDVPASIWNAAIPYIFANNFKATLFVVVSAIGKYNIWDEGKPVPRTECMTSNEINALLEDGWEIGSHTITHAELQTLTPDQLKEEVEGSKKGLEAMFNTEVKSFCYPYGGCNDAVRQEVINAGYTSACAISAKTGSVTEDLFRLKRIYIKPEDSLFTFKRKVAPWYLMLRGIKKR